MRIFNYNFIFLLTLFVFIHFDLSAQVEEEYKLRIRQLEEDYDDLFLDFKLKNAKVDSLSKVINKLEGKLRNEKEEGKDWQEKYKKELEDNTRLRSRVNLLAIEIEELNQTIKERDEEIEKLKQEKIALIDTLDKAENNIAGLVRDTILLNNIIRAKDLQIEYLEHDTMILNKEIRILKIRIEVLLERIDLLLERIIELKARIDYLEEKNIADKLSFITAYGGINYSLFNSSHLFLMDRQVHSDLTFTFYNIFMGSGFFFQIPMRYQNYSGSLSEIKKVQHYLEENLDVYVQELDIMGNSTFGYTKPIYSETQGDFRVYNYGVNLTVARNFYLIAGLSNIRGTTWDLYSGDLDAYGNLVDGAAPEKYNNHYIVNFEELSVNKGMLGVAAAFTIDKEKYNRTRSKTNQGNFDNLSRYNYRFGFQLEVGYNWLYDDIFVNVGLHTRLFNYSKDRINPPEEEVIPANEIRDAVFIVKEGFWITEKIVVDSSKKEELENKASLSGYEKKELKRIKKDLKGNTYAEVNDIIVEGLSILVAQLRLDSKFEREKYNKLIFNMKPGEEELDKKFSEAKKILEKAKSMDSLSRCLAIAIEISEDVKKADNKVKDYEKLIADKRKEACSECFNNHHSFHQIMYDYLLKNMKSEDIEKVSIYTFLEAYFSFDLTKVIQNPAINNQHTNE